MFFVMLNIPLHTASLCRTMSGKVRHTVFLHFKSEVATQDKIDALVAGAEALKVRIQVRLFAKVLSNRNDWNNTIPVLLDTPALASAGIFGKGFLHARAPT